jgi:pyruvate/2-oxoacid:ferredoxin oxidoreductase alpha subunit
MFFTAIVFLFPIGILMTQRAVSSTLNPSFFRQSNILGVKNTFNSVMNYSKLHATNVVVASQTMSS